MKEFKTLGPTQFGIGDGAKTRFSVARPGDIVRDSSIESVRRVGWQGDQLLYPYPRTNLAIASNDFTNSAWKGSPSLYIDFLAGIMPSQVSFSRATTATYIGRDRLIHTAAIDEPRFVYDPATGKSEGLLVEGQATNLLLWSEELSQGYYNKNGDVSVSEVSGAAPDGGSAYQVIGATGSVGADSSGIDNFRFFVTLPGGILTLSFWIWSNSATTVAVRRRVTGAGLDETDTVQISPGFNRVSFTDDYGVGTTGRFILGNADGDFFFWGIQLEEGTHPTSYIPTEGSQVTRAADDAVIPVGDWFNPDEGTLVIKAELPSLQTETFGRIFELSDATQDNRVLVTSNDSGRIRLQTTVNGVLALTPYTPLSNPKLSVAVAWGSGAARWAINGDAIQDLDQSPVITNSPMLTLLASRSFTNRNNGTVERLAYYPRALSDAELEALTS